MNNEAKKKSTVPLKTVNEIIQKVLGGKVKTSKSFVKLMQECGNAFIGHLAMELVIQAEKDHVKTIGEKQVLNALNSLGFSKMKSAVEKKISETDNDSKKRASHKRNLLVVDDNTVDKMVKIQLEKNYTVFLNKFCFT